MKSKDLKEKLNEFVLDTLLDYEYESDWKSEFRGSGLPVCPRRLVLSKLYEGEIKTTLTFTQEYYFEVGKSIHRLVQKTWGAQGLLWGDWECSNIECGMKFQNRILEKGRCQRCGSRAEYVEKVIKDEESGFSGHCDGVIWFPLVQGFVALEAKSRNFNIIKDRMGKKPYESDFYQVSAYATLIARQFNIPIVGRYILWIGKPRPKPFCSWFYPGLGEELFESQVQAVKRTKMLYKEKRFAEMSGLCEDMEDADGCPFAPICFSRNRDEMILEKYKEFGDNAPEL